MQLCPPYPLWQLNRLRLACTCRHHRRDVIGATRARGREQASDAVAVFAPRGGHECEGSSFDAGDNTTQFFRRPTVRTHLWWCRPVQFTVDAASVCYLSAKWGRMEADRSGQRTRRVHRLVVDGGYALQRQLQHTRDAAWNMPLPLLGTPSRCCGCGSWGSSSSGCGAVSERQLPPFHGTWRHAAMEQAGDRGGRRGWGDGSSDSSSD